MGIEGGKHATLASAHVEASEPEVIFFSLHQHGVIHI
jgi:hypothetical protein